MDLESEYRSWCANFLFDAGAPASMALWWMCTRRKRFIVLLGPAMDAVAAVKCELETNERLRAAYGDLRGSRYGFPWRRDDLVVVHHAVGRPKVIRLCGVPVRSLRLRTLRFLCRRPDAILASAMAADGQPMTAMAPTWWKKNVVPLARTATLVLMPLSASDQGTVDARPEEDEDGATAEIVPGAPRKEEAGL